jgi:hypothetical protein
LLLVTAAFWGEKLVLVKERTGMGGMSGEGAHAELDRDDSMREFRRSLLGVAAGSGAVCGVKGVEGVFPDRGPLTLASYFFEGPMAMRASESLWLMERRRLCGDCLMMGEAAFVVEVS